MMILIPMDLTQGLVRLQKTMKILVALMMLMAWLPTMPVAMATTTPLRISEKVCIGTKGRLSVPADRERHYTTMKNRYTNCTFVDGNLELTWIQNKTSDLSFLKHIREVTGYVLISHIDVKHVVFPALQIIRGKTLFGLHNPDYTEQFALFVTFSQMYSLEMPALRDILEGSVGMISNVNLCHINTISWPEILSGPKAEVVIKYNMTEPPRQCQCHHSCSEGCWGEGEHNCQKFSKIMCLPQCSQGRCFGNGPRDCCHLFCAGGCFGPTESDCLACKHFYDDGKCKKECPSLIKYDSYTYSWKKNPNGKYAYGASCVKECPSYLLIDNGACVRFCPPDKENVNGTCTACKNGTCTKSCEINSPLHDGNIDSFEKCTTIEGNLVLLDHSFDGFLDLHPNFTFSTKYDKMDVSKLQALRNVREVTGYVSIQADLAEFTDLSFLSNLEIIGGRETTEFFASLLIVKTSLKSLNLKSLKEIRAGRVFIVQNSDLCYADTIKWKSIFQKRTDFEKSIEVFDNKPAKDCRNLNLVCHEQCSDSGCWGPGDNNCLFCKNVEFEGRCLSDCNREDLYRINSTSCGYCHKECVGGCTGPAANQCVMCKYAEDDGFCVSACVNKYNENGKCKKCHKNCKGGCIGPENNLGPNGCNECDKAVIRDHNGKKEIDYCLAKRDSCEVGYFDDLVVSPEVGELQKMIGKVVCLKCHPQCKNCTGFGFHIEVCSECKMYRRDEHCSEQCPQNYYTNSDLMECLKCSSECSQGCYGPTERDCIACRNYRIYAEGETINSTNFNCTASCPPEVPYKIFPEKSDPYCGKHPVPIEDRFTAILVGSLVCLLLLGFFLTVFCYLWWKRNKTREAALKMTLTMMPNDDNEPLKPTNIKPNLAKLRIVKEAELRKGGILGYGAFGTVYKGVWVPEGENVKIPVAIKVLREGSGTNVNKEILEEAYIMASVDHPNLLQLLAVCMTTQIMLVTQLMPLGCLLDYVRNNKEKIGSKPLLNWCTQIARGMAYLEDRRLVHRDLAARNVLVQTPNCVKITDFGLAKLLDYDEDEYKAAGGKMPIKWLALECIQHRVFTHKSDVWAFGVTVWEILTYGGRPYEDLAARLVPNLLEKGERLPQPSICSIEIYMLMIRCWMIDAESRPSFRELAEQFAKMARDPGRFLVIPGDKLMRLPSYTPQDERELIRSLSSNIGGDGIVMAAEEYLQPKYGMILPGNTSSSTSEPATPIKKNPMGYSSCSNGNAIPPDYLSRSESPQNRHNLQREKKYAHLEAGGNSSPDQRLRGDSLSSRYCSDPLKMIDTEMGDDDCFEADPSTDLANGDVTGRPGYGWVGGIRLDLPLDEDDYLMPSQQPGVASTNGPSHQHYMDLINDGTDGLSQQYDRDMQKFNGKLNGSVPKYMNGLQNQWVGMDNPEYHMTNNRAPMYSSTRNPPQQTLGIPALQPDHFLNYNNNNTENTNGNNSGHSSVSSNNVNGNHSHWPFHSSSPDPAHEYYNELNQVNHRGPRSETTV